MLANNSRVLQLTGELQIRGKTSQNPQTDTPSVKVTCSLDATARRWQVSWLRIKELARLPTITTWHYRPEVKWQWQIEQLSPLQSRGRLCLGLPDWVRPPHSLLLFSTDDWRSAYLRSIGIIPGDLAYRQTVDDALDAIAFKLEKVVDLRLFDL